MTFEEIRAVALALPGVEEGTSYGTPAFRVGKKLICRLWEDGEVLVTRAEPGLAMALIAADPRVYFITPHYQGYDYVLVRIGLARMDEVASLLADAWMLVAPKKFRDATG